MRARLWFYGIASVIVGLLLILTIGIPARTNCGGNSAALSDCQTYVLALLVEAADNPGHPFLLTNISPETRKEFAFIARPNHWIRKAHYLVSTEPLIGAELPIPKDPKNRRILIVCDTPFTNVPERRFWHAPPPIHVVGYSDGATGLISPAEFAALDRSTFKRLDELFPESTH